MAAYPPKRGFKKMKKTNRWISALLAAVLLLSVSLTAAAEDVTVFIPGRLAKLQLAESFDGDPFNTGVEGAVTTLVWDDATIQTSCGGYKKLDYIRQVIVTYPEGNYIRKVVAGYGNDKKKSLTKYTITYQVGEKQLYTVSYAPKTNTVVEDHYRGRITPPAERSLRRTPAAVKPAVPFQQCRITQLHQPTVMKTMIQFQNHSGSHRRL